MHRSLVSLAAFALIAARGVRGYAQQRPVHLAAETDAAPEIAAASDEAVAAIQRRALLDHTASYPDLRAPHAGAVRVDVEHTGGPLLLLRATSVRHLYDTYQGTRYPYTITDTQRLCMTPCTLYLPPGPTALRVSALGLRTDDTLQFDTSIDGARVRVQGYVAPREQWAELNAWVGVPSLVVGLFWLAAQATFPVADPVAQRDVMWSVGGVTLAGGVQALVALVLSSFAQPHLLDVGPLRPRRPRVAFLGASVAPDAAQHGAHAALAFAF